MTSLTITRMTQQEADAFPQSKSPGNSPSPTSSRPATTSAAATVVLLSLECAGNKSATIFRPQNGGSTDAYGFTASCGLDCGASNLFIFEKYNVELCATTCAGKTDGQCGAMVFKYAGTSTNSSNSGEGCILTTSCLPRS